MAWAAAQRGRAGAVILCPLATPKHFISVTEKRLRGTWTRTGSDRRANGPGQATFGGRRCVGERTGEESARVLPGG